MLVIITFLIGGLIGIANNTPSSYTNDIPRECRDYGIIEDRSDAWKCVTIKGEEWAK